MDFDVIVAGAGPGGCLAARDLSRGGLRVGLFDQGERDNLTKTIVIDAEKAMFDTVGLARPGPDETPFHAARSRIISSRGKEAFSMDGDHPAIGMFQDLLVKRILKEAETAGTQFFPGYKAMSAIVTGGRVNGVTFEHKGSTQEIKARLAIDATGFDANLVRNLDPDLGFEFPDRKGDIVIAENRLHKVIQDAADEAIKNRLHGDEESWVRLGTAGPYSTENSFLSKKNNIAYILIGFKKDHDGPSIGEYISRFRDRMGYFGEHLRGGIGPINISHSLDKFVSDGFMVIGEAACQVIPVHGSGVASALYAGHLAAKTAVEALKDGARPTTDSLWPYCAQYQRGRGAVLATLNVSRLVVDSYTVEKVATMIESGIMQPEDPYNTAIPKAVGMSLSSIPKRLLGLIKNPGLIPSIMTIGRTGLKVSNHYEAYPKTCDVEAFNAWRRKTKDLFKPLMDKAIY